MPALQVRDFPPDLYAQLKERAELEHRSIAQQTVVAVESYLHQTGTQERKPFTLVQGEGLTRAQKRQRVYDKIDGLPKLEIPEGFPSDVELLRQCRQERDLQLMDAIGEGGLA